MAVYTEVSDDELADFLAGYEVGALLSYNLSCAQARLGRIDDAIASLSDAIDRGFAAPNALLEDPDLAPLRIHPRFPDLLARTRANQERKR